MFAELSLQGVRKNPWVSILKTTCREGAVTWSWGGSFGVGNHNPLATLFQNLFHFWLRQARANTKGRSSTSSSSSSIMVPIKSWNKQTVSVREFLQVLSMQSSKGAQEFLTALAYLYSLTCTVRASLRAPHLCMCRDPSRFLAL